MLASHNATRPTAEAVIARIALRVSCRMLPEANRLVVTGCYEARACAPDCCGHLLGVAGERAELALLIEVEQLHGAVSTACGYKVGLQTPKKAKTGGGQT